MDLTSIPHVPGVYLMRDRSGQILYVGKARDLARRVASYFMERADHTARIAALVSSIHHVDYVPARSERDALIIERRLIHRLQPHFNRIWKDDKTYPHIKLTWKEDFPRLFMTRKILRDGSKYFGPYPHVTPLRRLLRYLWKQHMFPLRPCHYEFSESHPLPMEKAKQCLYYHTQECPAPCVGRITRTGYREIAQGAKQFFKGDFRPLIETWKQELRDASKAQDYEQAAVLRDNVTALEHMDERITVREIQLEELGERIDRSRGITELQRALALKRPPIRMECFDISHFQGAATVASMVVFERGEPRKDEYRKFKIKTVRGIDDFAGMGEVVGRRYRRLREEGRVLPDLILIDGGKGQLSAACKALRQVWGTPSPALRAPSPSGRGEGEGKRIAIPIASLAKRKEELFLPDLEEAIRLPRDSAALHLVQRIRDEAHRFAIRFHRERRAKQFIPPSGGNHLQ